MSATLVSAALIANTDYGWFSHSLHGAEPPNEVDFWQPSPHGFKAIPPDAPFFFALGAPHKAIAGFSLFARYERVPAWLAWESLGDKNGTDTFAEMAARIEAIRRRKGSALLARARDYETDYLSRIADLERVPPMPSRSDRLSRFEAGGAWLEEEFGRHRGGNGELSA